MVGGPAACGGPIFFNAVRAARGMENLHVRMCIMRERTKGRVNQVVIFVSVVIFENLPKVRGRGVEEINKSFARGYFEFARPIFGFQKLFSVRGARNRRGHTPDGDTGALKSTRREPHG